MKSVSLWKCYFLGLALLLSVLFVFYQPVILGGRDYFVSDHTYFFEPFARFIEEGLRRGRLPSWNPYLYCGMSQLANPSPGIFYFPTALFAFLPYSQSMALTLALSQVVAYGAGFLMAVELSLPAAAACALGLMLALNGYMFSLSANYSLPATAAWGFLTVSLFLIMMRSDGRKRLTYMALSALTCHLTIMAGRPEIFIPIFSVLAVVALAPLRRLKQENMGRLLTAFLFPAASFALAILMSMVSIAPGYEWTKLSPRASGLALSQVFLWSANWYDFICVFTGQPLGDLQHALSRFLSVVTSRKGYFPFLPTAHVGSVVLLLACLSLAYPGHKLRRLLLLAGFLIAACLAAGDNTPLSRLVLAAVPPLAVLRYPVKLLVFSNYFLCLLAAHGFAQTVSDSYSSELKRLIKLLCAIFLSLSLLFGLAYLLRDFYGGQTFKIDALAVKEFTLSPPAFFAMLFKSLFLSAFIAFLLSLVLAFSERLKLGSREKTALIMGALLGSILTPSYQMPPRTVAADFYRNVPLADKLEALSQEPGSESFAVKGRGRYLTCYFDPLVVAKGYVPRQPNQFGETYMQYCRELLLPNTNVSLNYPVTFGYEAAETKDYHKAFLDCLHKSSVDVKGASDLPLYRFCLITSTRFLGTQIKGKKGPFNLMNPIFFELIEENKAYNRRLYKVRQAGDRYYVSKRYREAKSVAETTAWLLSKQPEAAMTPEAVHDSFVDLIETTPDIGSVFEQDNFFYRDTEDEKDLERLQMASLNRSVTGLTPGRRPLVSSAKLLTDEDNHLTFSVSMEKDGYFVLNDRFYPGWHVKVDSLPARLLRANGFMRAVHLNAGSHLVEFDFRPKSFSFGLFLTAVGFALTLVCLLVGLAPLIWQGILFLSYGSSRGKAAAASQGVQEQ